MKKMKTKFEDLNKDYFEDCPNLFIDSLDSLNYESYKKDKIYMKIKEIINLNEN